MQLSLLGTPEEDDCHLLFTVDQLLWLAVELCWLVVAQAVKWMGNGLARPVGIICLVFLVPKKGPTLWWLVIDQRWLNLVLAKLQCKFEMLSMLVWLAGQNWWVLWLGLLGRTRELRTRIVLKL